MDNWMAPRAFGGGAAAAGAGGNGKLAKQGKAAGQAAAAASPSGGGGAGESGEEGGEAGAAAMGLLKRKRTSPPESPAPSSKKRTSEEPELPKSSSTGEPQAQEGTPGKPPQSGNSRPSPGDVRVSKQLLAQENNESVKGVLAPEEAVVRSSFEKDVDDLQSRVPASVENVSHGQGATFQARPPPDTSSPAKGLTVECEARSPVLPHRIPSHAGWFQWAKIHPLERLALPEFFSGKSSQKTPETYMEHRNCIITKYRENPQTLLKLEDVQGLLTGDVSGAGRLFGFLDHWGIINYQAISDFSPFIPARGTLSSVEETNNGALQFSPLVKPALANLFHFEAAMAPVPKLLSPGAGPASNLPLSSLAEAAVQESLAAPAVEYHCNSCQADCSKRRYHCQKQADFDLCVDCYSDGKFGQGMTGTDFLRMDALTETADANGGGWSDQETLLLLEALELYGDNWTEIAEHVATKSKAQCILHFVRLPIEDPFLEDMEAPKAVITAPQPPTGVSDAKSTAPSNDNDAQAKTPQNENPPTSEATEASPLTTEQDTSVPSQKENKDTPSVPPTAESNAATPKPEEREESDASKESSKVEESSAKHPLLTVSESAGCAGPNGLIAFADAGNPVMTQVAFLAAMVGPRVAAAAAQAALKSLAEEDPVGFLSAKNSLTLDSADNKDGSLVSDGPERLMTGHQSTENQSVASAGGPTVSSDNKAALTTTEDAVKEDTLEKGTVEEKPSGGEGGAEMSQEPELNVSTSAVVADQDVPSIAKVRNAAVSALASAAVKAKLLADQEEREIQRLVAGVIENQLKKLELKLKHFNELESMLGKECEQAEKARAKVNAERARIVASRLGSTSSASQMQPMGSSSTPFTKPSSVPSSSGTQPRPAVFTFGPTGVSAPAPVYKAPSGPEPSSSSMAAAASSQQGLAPQRLPRPIPGTSLAPSVK